ncbi:MAG: hypothetical protein OEZ39_16620 [Gammaproteobacteria bacterium]|nr:hypothetical protein [Gammaproteobacteria bacterium]MDH5653485.1 hypothetical protein [Gammaproteobacteria bacterium]
MSLAVKLKKALPVWGAIASIFGGVIIFFEKVKYFLLYIIGYYPGLVLSLVTIPAGVYFYKQCKVLNRKSEIYARKSALYGKKIKERNGGLEVAKDVQNICCFNNHKHTKQLKYSIFDLYKLETDMVSIVDKIITDSNDFEKGIKEVQSRVFTTVEKLTCDYGREMATSLKYSLDATISMLGFQNQNTRILIKTLDNEAVTQSDGTKILSDGGCKIDNAIWDLESWKIVKKEIKKNGLPPHNLEDSTALLHIARGKCDFYVNNNTRNDPYYDSAPDIYEKGYSAKLAIPIRYIDEMSNKVLLFGFVVVLLENTLGEEIFKDTDESLLVSMTFSVVNLLVILMSSIHNTNLLIESKIEDRCGAILQNRRLEDRANKG